MSNRIPTLCALLFLILCEVDSAKILAYFTVPSVSHQYVFQAIWRELSLRGHEVTVITPNPLGDSNIKNLKEIDVSVAYKIFEKYDFSNTRREASSIYNIIKTFQDAIEYAFELEMNNEEVKTILKKADHSFDLIIVESMNLMGYGLQHKFKAPLVAISTTALSSYTHYVYGNPMHPILYPDILAGTFGALSLWQKIDSLYVTFATWLICQFYVIPHADKLARSYFGNDMPHIEVFEKNTVLFYNVNPIFSERRPNVPNVMEFSQVHLSRNENISSDLQTILDKAKDGVVYFSLGTNVRFDHVQGDIKKTILQALGELPYTVLCKWESEDFPGKPNNVVLRKWFPQQSILAHPNVKVFVTQGGLQSSEEAISNGIPLVVIPFLGDQPMNARILTTRGMAETIFPKDLDKDILRDTILKVAKDDKYRLKAQQLREIFLDQPQSGVDKIVWWCEYVIRHKGAEHLRSPAADIPLYEYFMLDVIAVILVALYVIYKVISLFLRTLIGLLRGKKSVKEKKN